MIWFEAKNSTKELVEAELSKMKAQWEKQPLTKLALIQMQAQMKGVIGLVQHLEMQDEALFNVFPVAEATGKNIALYLNCPGRSLGDVKSVIEFWSQFGLYVRYSPV